MKNIKIDFVKGELDYLTNKTPTTMKQYLSSIAKGHKISFEILLYVYNVGYEMGKKQSKINE